MQGTHPDTAPRTASRPRLAAATKAERRPSVFCAVGGRAGCEPRTARGPLFAGQPLLRWQYPLSIAKAAGLKARRFLLSGSFEEDPIA